ncbi:hypothetical protein WLY71_05225 [Pseudomonas sp. P2663]
MIEWYDFYIYATAAALVFGALFFPSDAGAADSAAHRFVAPWPVA